MNQFRVELHVHVLSPIPTTISPTLRTYLHPQPDSLTFLVRVIRDHVDPHAWGTGSTPLLSYTSPTAFPCSGKVVNPGEETLPDSNCLELNTIHLICPQISEHETVYNPLILKEYRLEPYDRRGNKNPQRRIELNDLIDLQLNKLKTRKDDIYGPQSVSYTT